MKEDPALSTANHRNKVGQVFRQHADIHGWQRHALGVGSNHVHKAVTAEAVPQTVRDQFKSNAERVLRQSPDAIASEKVWTGRGDIEILDDAQTLEKVVTSIMEAQDCMQRGK